MTMTRDEIRAAVAADGYLSSLGTSMDAATEIAAAISAGRTRIVERLITERGIISALGPAAGDAFLSGLEAFVASPPPEGHPLAAAFPGIKRMLSWIKPPADGVDIGDPLTRQLLTLMVALGIPGVTEASVAAILSRAEVPDPVPVDAVYQAIQN